MSIVRVGLSEAGQFSAGYDAIFGGRKKPAAKKVVTKKAKPAMRQKPAKKKKK